MKRTMLFSVLAGAALTAGLVASTAAARYGPPDGGGGGGHEETMGNNLSIPAIFVGAGGPSPRLACGAAQAPGVDGVPSSTDYPGYWLQKTEATWTAACNSAPIGTVNVMADWGDNLTKGATLTSGKPVRVEVGLLDLSATGMTGYRVTNLTPTLEDRLATYGTRPADVFLSGADPASAVAPPTRVFDAGARLKIEKLDELGGSPTALVYNGTMTAEINSGGAIVYGYNWGTKGRANAAAPGVYRLTFTANNTEIIGITDDGQPNAPVFDTENDTTTIEITLVSTKPGGGKPAQ